MASKCDEDKQLLLDNLEDDIDQEEPPVSDEQAVEQPVSDPEDEQPLVSDQPSIPSSDSSIRREMRRQYGTSSLKSAVETGLVSYFSR